MSSKRSGIVVGIAIVILVIGMGAIFGTSFLSSVPGTSAHAMRVCREALAYREKYAEAVAARAPAGLEDKPYIAIKSVSMFGLRYVLLVEVGERYKLITYEPIGGVVVDEDFRGESPRQWKTLFDINPGSLNSAYSESGFHNWCGYVHVNFPPMRKTVGFLNPEPDESLPIRRIVNFAESVLPHYDFAEDVQLPSRQDQTYTPSSDELDEAIANLERNRFYELQ